MSQPESSFSVVYRNYGHWDFVNQKGRLFRLRGSGGEWLAMDERQAPYPVTRFRTFTLALAFICEILMHEDLTPDKCGNNKPAG